MVNNFFIFCQMTISARDLFEGHFPLYFDTKNNLQRALGGFLLEKNRQIAVSQKLGSTDLDMHTMPTPRVIYSLLASENI